MLKQKCLYNILKHNTLATWTWMVKVLSLGKISTYFFRKRKIFHFLCFLRFSLNVEIGSWHLLPLNPRYIVSQSGRRRPVFLSIAARQRNLLVTRWRFCKAETWRPDGKTKYVRRMLYICSAAVSPLGFFLKCNSCLYHTSLPMYNLNERSPKHVCHILFRKQMFYWKGSINPTLNKFRKSTFCVTITHINYKHLIKVSIQYF